MFASIIKFFQQNPSVFFIVICCEMLLTASIPFYIYHKKSGAEEITFSQQIAPLLYQHCAECHRPGEAAPFSVLSYQDVRPWAKSIREQVITRKMPPWHADPHVGQWANDRRLSEETIKQIVAWVDSGAPSGDLSKTPAPPQFETGWRIGKPDLILTMPKEFSYQAGKSDTLQYFRLPTNFKEDMYVQSAEARPGNRKIVHHIIAHIEPPNSKVSGAVGSVFSSLLLPFYKSKLIVTTQGGLTRTKPDAPVFNDGCSLKNGGAGVFKDGKDEYALEAELDELCAYAPGSNAIVWEPGSYKKIPAGASIVLEVHYSNVFNNDAAQTDRSSVGLIFAKDPQQRQRELFTGSLMNLYFQIPAGAENHVVTACHTIKQDITVLSLMPHMHTRGKAMEYRAIFPDGRAETLFKLAAWDFNWQTTYQLKTPRMLPKGTKLIATAWYDNSAKNRFNPDPTKIIRWGDATTDEMMLAYYEYFVNAPAQEGAQR